MLTDLEAWLLSKMRAHGLVRQILGKAGLSLRDLASRAQRADQRWNLESILRRAEVFTAAIGAPLSERVLGESEAGGAFAGSIERVYHLTLWPGVDFVVNEVPDGTAWGVRFRQRNRPAGPVDPRTIVPWEWDFRTVQSTSTRTEVIDEWTFDKDAVVHYTIKGRDVAYLAQFDFELLQTWEPARANAWRPGSRRCPRCAMRAGLIVVIVLAIALAGAGVYALARRRARPAVAGNPPAVARHAKQDRSRPKGDWNELWDARKAALTAQLGPAEDRILTPLPPFHLGGDAEVLTFPNHAGGVAYVTASLIGDDRVKPNKHGQYELMICLRRKDDWAPSLMSRLGPYTTEAVLQPGETMDIAPALPQPTKLSNVLFVHHADLKVEGKPCGVLLCLGITPDEMNYLHEHGLDALLEKLKEAKVYPFTDLKRASVTREQ